MSDTPQPPAKRRGAQIDPPNRYEATHRELTFEDREYDEELLGPGRIVPTQFLPDHSQSILSENQSPDIGFRYSINPYRGCEHGCTYCYARPTHEMLGMSAGLDFETKILVKHRAAELLRKELARRSWQPAPIALSGVTDCYQPAERQFRITRSCLEVLWRVRNPVVIITKNALVLRDRDVLSNLARERLVHVRLSITTLDQELAHTMEPRTSRPAARLQAVRQLHDAGVPVGVMVAPIIPGLNDAEIPALLQAAKEAGAASANYTLLRLPWTVRPVFLDWLKRHFPLKEPRVLSLLRACREGKLNDPHFGSRMRGSGFYAEQIATTFRLFVKKFGLDNSLPELDCTQFQRPTDHGAQLELFS